MALILSQHTLLTYSLLSTPPINPPSSSSSPVVPDCWPMDGSHTLPTHPINILSPPNTPNTPINPPSSSPVVPDCWPMDGSHTLPTHPINILSPPNTPNTPINPPSSSPVVPDCWPMDGSQWSASSNPYSDSCCLNLYNINDPTFGTYGVNITQVGYC